MRALGCDRNSATMSAPSSPPLAGPHRGEANPRQPARKRGKPGGVAKPPGLRGYLGFGGACYQGNIRAIGETNPHGEAREAK